MNCGVLRLDMQSRTKVVGFADDIAVKHMQDIEKIASKSVG